MKRSSALATALVAVCAGMATAQAGTDAGGQAGGLDASGRELARSVLQQLIETNTTLSVGSVTKASEAMRDRLLHAGFPAGDMEMIGGNQNRLNLVVRYRAAGKSDAKPVLFICHLDVVEANRSDWTLDPFKLTEKDGFFYGRGTQDMKDSDAAVVTSLIRLKQSGWTPKRDLIVALTADEEGGKDNGVDWLLRNRRDLVGDAGFVINPDSGGVELIDGKPHMMALEATEKVYSDFEITANNRGGHSSLPRPDNAIYELTAALEKVEHTPFPAELNAVTRAYYEEQLKTAKPERAALIRGVLATPMDPAAVASLSDDPEDNATLRTTCVATMIEGGHAPNALPGSAQANVNCRILPGVPPEQIRQQLIALFADPKLTVQYKSDAGVLSPTAPERGAIAPPPLKPELMKPLRAITTEEFGDIPIVPIMEPGASDSIYTAAAGMPSYGVSGMGVDRGDMRAHGRDERLRVESYYKGVAFQQRLMRALGDE